MRIVNSYLSDLIYSLRPKRVILSFVAYVIVSLQETFVLFKIDTFGFFIVCTGVVEKSYSSTDAIVLSSLLTRSCMLQVSLKTMSLNYVCLLSWHETKCRTVLCRMLNDWRMSDT